MSAEIDRQTNADAASAGDATAARGLLVVISGPSGVGKTTLVDHLLAQPGFERAVTATTRQPRPGEQDGRDYHFLAVERFREDLAAGRFLEHAEVYGRLYGTPRHAVDTVLTQGGVCLLNIDVQGAATLRDRSVDALYIFLLPPSTEELERRLISRGTGSPEELQARLDEARAELARAPEYDASVVNDDLDTAIGHIQGLVDARLRLTRS